MLATRGVLGVGIIGLGPVTQAIHLPTLAGLADEFRVVHVMDLDGATARAVADPIGARWSTSVDDLLADEGVDVVAVCSPHSHHVAHAIASLRAGKAVLCEKPLAVDPSGLDELRLACQDAASPLVVGWMHAYDPVAMAAIDSWIDGGNTASAIRVSVVLPPNGRFERAAAEMFQPAQVPGPPGEAALREAILSLAVHDLPLIRRLIPDSSARVEISHASWRAPWGYLVLATVGDLRVELHATLGQPWKPDWALEAISGNARLEIRFPPSYVHAGSAISRLARSDGRVDEAAEDSADGYDREWMRLAEAVRGGAAGALDDALVDAEFTIAFADAAERWADEAISA
jgi:myo-inositol 2-dehydrogenase/D-chiro-inositol 1-dehydrogenase